MFRRDRLLRILYVTAIGIAVLCTDLAAQSPAVRRITLEEAQSLAGAANPAVNLSHLAIDAARFHKREVEADYFPKISSTFTNLHFNKFLGQTIQLARRQASLPLLSKDQTVVVVTAVQPVTPLLKVREAVRIAAADEAIARAKALDLTAQASTAIERSYFDLLIAQREENVIKAKFNAIQSTLQLATTGELPFSSILQHQKELIEASKELLEKSSRVIEFTMSLNHLMKIPSDTLLELVPPPPSSHTINLSEATGQAQANSPEIFEAEQTVVKAGAAAKLGKLDYVPDVAVLGGYSYQNAIPALPNDFSFLGIMATWTIFDFGKRENTISERRTQLEMARANVEMVRAKIAGIVQKAFNDLERTRQIRDLTSKIMSSYRTIPAASQFSLDSSDPAWGQADAEMLRAELDYREAYWRLKHLMDGR